MSDTVYTTTNTKGQLVIPSKFRKLLGITPKTTLRLKVVNDQVVVHPLPPEPEDTPKMSKDEYLKYIKKIQGSWGPETEAEKKHRLQQEQVDIKAVIESKNAW